MLRPVDARIIDILVDRLKIIEEYFDADVISYYGPIFDNNENHFLSIVEELAQDENKRNRICIILTTGGGSARAVERYVNIIRHHYSEVLFIVPDYAYSAGTIFCMSGDQIYMDYYSVLGPIDPQVQSKEGKWVAALGYLDKVNELLEKAKTNELTQAEFLILKDIDLAELREYEQAKELTIALLKKWLVKYKFKDWHTHATNPKLKGQPVSDEEKAIRAEEIASQLSDNNLWKSHGRPINLETLMNDIRLKIEDYSNNDELRNIVRSYYNLQSNYVIEREYPIFVQTRKLS